MFRLLIRVVPVSPPVSAVVWPESLSWTIGVKVVVLALSALGYASLWSAVFADVGVTALAVLNALRTLRKTV